MHSFSFLADPNFPKKEIIVFSFGKIKNECSAWKNLRFLTNKIAASDIRYVSYFLP